ncbi:hypothetical protein SAMN00790413_03787 [Deinococcus hopiensis KR-140]|uniref:Uncharacterized protein n=2 Tax=Deinococcus TaxID=1298 RepID=A0A1W1UZ38_9DEIO|nr:hypothetical protein SAMN00790413_03787 [Deinococcus hopiensis KR-140]
MRPMNEALMTALASALEARVAVDAGRFDEARQLLVIMDEHLDQGQGGNAAHSARRKKILRLESEVRDLLPAAETPTAKAAPVVEATPTDVEVSDAPVVTPVAASTADDVAPPVAQASTDPKEVTSPALEPVAAKKKGVAAPQHLPAEAWALVGEALRAEGADVATLDALAARHRYMVKARTERNTYGMKVAERLALQAEVEAAALRGDVDAANKAWDRLFDVVTAIRGAAQKLRRAGTPDPEKDRDYDAARVDSLKIKAWARGR